MKGSMQAVNLANRAGIVALNGFVNQINPYFSLNIL